MSLHLYAVPKSDAKACGASGRYTRISYYSLHWIPTQSYQNLSLIIIPDLHRDSVLWRETLATNPVALDFPTLPPRWRQNIALCVTGHTQPANQLALNWRARVSHSRYWSAPPGLLMSHSATCHWRVAVKGDYAVRSPCRSPSLTTGTPPTCHLPVTGLSQTWPGLWSDTV